MRIGAMKRLLPSLVAILLLAGGVALGALQVYWVRVALRADESRARISLDRGAQQVTRDAEDEIRVILSLTRISPADFSAGNWTQMAANMQLWYANTRFPQLLKGLYIIRRLPTGDVLVYSKDLGRFVSAQIPQQLRESVASLLLKDRSQRSWPTVTLADWRRLVVVPILSSTAGPALLPPAAGAVAVDLNTRVLFETVVPSFMRQDMGDFLYRVTASESGHVFAESPSLSAGRQPEQEVGVSSVQDTGDPGKPGPDLSGVDAVTAIGSASFPVDPLLQSWLQRTQGLAAPAAFPPDRLALSDAEAKLQIFYPKGTLAGTMRTQAALNIGVSLGLLAFLLASVVVLSQLYRRSVKLRESEQEFVASVSHELRTPISVIQATSENLRGGVVREPARLTRYAEVIHGQIRRLSGMVESILLYSGLQSGMARTPTLTEIDLPTLIQDIVAPLQDLAAERSSTLRLTTESLPASILSDRMALRLIMENLVMNAIRHADPGEIRMTVSHVASGALSIAVEDDGPGIPLREQARVFEPFIRGERSARDQRPGSGLGLHLVKRVVALLGGKVSLESPYADQSGESRKGCRFTVVFPGAERGHAA
jgi:signal transduction histidine kinase